MRTWRTSPSCTFVLIETLVKLPVAAKKFCPAEKICFIVLSPSAPWNTSVAVPLASALRLNSTALNAKPEADENVSCCKLLSVAPVIRACPLAWAVKSRSDDEVNAQVLANRSVYQTADHRSWHH